MTTLLPDRVSAAPTTPHGERMLVAMRDPVTDRAAVDWAARRAVSLGVQLTILHAVADPSLLRPGTAYGDKVIAGRDLVSDEAGRVVHCHPGLRVATYVHCGGIVEALLGMSASADMIIVGADRKDPGTGVFAGSVALLVGLNSGAPVVVVPPRFLHPSLAEDRGGVVAGVDGSQASYEALMRAAEEADAAGTSLTVVTAMGPSFEPMTVSASAMLVEVRRRHPSLPVRWVVDDLHSPLQALTLQGAGADLLIIGRHGAGARSISSLGSVTHSLLLEPPCPTLVSTHRVPPPLEGKAMSGPARTSAH